MMDQTRQKNLGETAHMQNAHKKGEAKGFSFYLPSKTVRNAKLSIQTLDENEGIGHGRHASGAGRNRASKT